MMRDIGQVIAPVSTLHVPLQSAMQLCERSIDRPRRDLSSTTDIILAFVTSE